MKNKFLTTVAALAIAGLVTVNAANAQIVVAPGGPVIGGGGPKAGGSGGGHGGAAAAYGIGVAVCTFVVTLADVHDKGKNEQRQLTQGEFLGDLASCAIPLIGGLIRAGVKPTPQELEAARVAWRWEKLPRNREQAWFASAGGATFQYPSVEQMRADLGEKAPKVATIKKTRYARHDKRTAHT